MLRPPISVNTMQFAVSEKIWYSGRAVMMISCALTHYRFQPCMRLHHVGDDIAVGQHCAFGYTGAAGVLLQEGDIVVADLNRFSFRRLPWAVCH